jgi:hypothetical protein
MKKKVLHYTWAEIQPRQNIQVQGHQVEVKGHWCPKMSKGATTPCVESVYINKKLLLHTLTENQPGQNSQVQIQGH